jgi:hypothetical protein
VSGTALLLIGSAKPPGTSASEALGRYLALRLEAHCMTTTTRYVSRSARGAGIGPLLRDLDRSDLMILATPLYVDALPYLVTRSLEAVARHRSGCAPPRRPRFAALVNCGFPEAQQCDTALAICRSFARHAGFEWAGGLAVPAGGVFGSRPLEEAGGRARRARDGLDLTARALAHGDPVPAEAAALLGRPAIPPSLYTTLANAGWILEARRNGVLWRIAERPGDRQARRGRGRVVF